MKTIYDWLENRGIHVKDREKILEAFTHSSFANEHHRLHNNERLEFMGDAVMEFQCHMAFKSFRRTDDTPESTVGMRKGTRHLCKTASS